MPSDATDPAMAIAQQICETDDDWEWAAGIIRAAYRPTTDLLEKLATALGRAASNGDQCYCSIRRAEKIKGKCWVCEARDALAAYAALLGPADAEGVTTR